MRNLLRRVVIFIWRPIGSLKFRMAYRKASRTGDLRLHVGVGRAHLDGWLNTDILPWSPLFLDATRRFPIPDNSVSYIQSEHFIEHVPRHAALIFFGEAFRVLRPSGVLRISTPSVENLARAYLSEPDRVLLLNERNHRLGYEYSCYPVDILNKAFL